MVLFFSGMNMKSVIMLSVLLVGCSVGQIKEEEINQECRKVAGIPDDPHYRLKTYEFNTFIRCVENKR